MITNPHPLVRRLPYPSIKPYIRPTPKLPAGKAESMTVVAGFRCVDGVLLAADTLISYGDVPLKTYQSKIIQINQELGVYLTYTNDPDFANEYARELGGSIVGHSESDVLVLADQISKRLWDARYIAPAEEDKLWAHMLVTIPEGSSISLYLIRGRNFIRVDQYEPLGAGFPQAKPFFNLFYRPWMNLSQCEFMARYVLARVKKFVPGCGGDTEVQHVPDDKMFRSTIKRINLRASVDIEEDFAFFDREMLPLLVAFSDLGVDKRSFRKLVNKAIKMLEEQREERFEQSPKLLKKYFQRTE